MAGIINYFYLWVQVQDCRLDLTLLSGCSPVAVRRIVACFPAPDIAEAGLIAEIVMLSGQLLRDQTAENGLKYESAKRIYTEMTNQKDEGPVIQEKN